MQKFRLNPFSKMNQAEILGDIFAHYSVIEMEGYRSLKAGQKVNFEVVHGEKGSHATKIVPIIE